MYLEEYPDDAMGLSKFKSLRPDVVLCKHKMPLNVRVHSYHANIDYILQNFKFLPNFPSSHTELLQRVVCDRNNEDCMFRKSKNCIKMATAMSLLATIRLDEKMTGEQIKWLSAEGQPKIEKRGVFVFPIPKACSIQGALLGKEVNRLE